jgi:hypothetical protein
MNKLLQNFDSMTPRHNLILHKAHTSKIFLREHAEILFGSILVVSIFSMHARRPIRPLMAIEPKIEVSAGDKAFTRLSL